MSIRCSRRKKNDMYRLFHYIVLADNIKWLEKKRKNNINL